MSYQNKFTVPHRKTNSFTDVQKVVEEILFQINKELTAISKSAVSSNQINYQSYGGSGGTTPTPVTTEYRAGAVTVTAGTNTITFTSALSTSDYIISWSLINGSNELSSATPIMTSRTDHSFQITCLEAGTLYYKVSPKK